MATFTIKLFAGLAEKFGDSTVLLHSESEALTAGELKHLLSESHPALAALIQSSFIAKNHAYARDEEAIVSTDELALIPPVSGGSGITGDSQAASGVFEITRDPLNVAALSASVNDPDHGANLVFIGTTREHTEGKRTIILDYDAYEPMAILTMRQIGDEIKQRWAGTRCSIIHRIGRVPVGEASVVIAVSSPHRADCYEASRYAIERLKQIVPIWKKEIWEDGSEWLGHQLGPWDPTKNETGKDSSHE
jgi:MoaE-MoaD fusion protein